MTTNKQKSRSPSLRKKISTIYKNIKEVISEKTISPIKSLLSWVTSFIVIIFIVGLSLIVGGIFHESQINGLFSYDKAANLVQELGKILLGAGVFAVILKSEQFSKIFQNHIANVFYDPEIIKNREIIDERWKVMTQSLLKKVLPEKYENAEQKIHEQFFDSNLHCQFEGFTSTYDITVDSNSKTATIVNTSSAGLVITDGIPNPIFVQEGSVLNGDEISVKKIKINSQSLPLEEIVEVDEDNKGYKITIELDQYKNLGLTKVPYIRITEAEQDLSQEPYISSYVSRYIKGTTSIKVKITEGFSVKFLKLGISLVSADDNDEIDHQGYKVWTLAKEEELLLPGQGYNLIIVEDTKSATEHNTPHT